MMDARRASELPRLQIGWIDNICLPLYQVFIRLISRKLELIKCFFLKNVSLLCDSFKGHLDRVEENRRNWNILNKTSELNFSNLSAEF